MLTFKPNTNRQTFNNNIATAEKSPIFTSHKSYKKPLGKIKKSAKILGEVVEKKINYVSPSREIYIETLSKAGVPMEYVEMFAGFSEAIKQGEFEIAKTDLENLLGRKPTTAKEFLKQVYSSKN